MRKSQNLWIRLSWDIFFSEQWVLSMRISGQTSQFYGFWVGGSWIQGQHKGSIFWEILVKKWCSPNRSRITLGRSLDPQGIKKHQRDDKTSTWRPPENFRKLTLKVISLRGFGSPNSQISHAGACVACGGASSGNFKWLVEHISCAL